MGIKKCCKTYAGVCDVCGEASVHIFENNVRAFARDVDHVKSVLPDLTEGLRANGMRFGGITPQLSMVVSDKEAMDNIAASRPQIAMRKYLKQANARQVS